MLKLFYLLFLLLKINIVKLHPKLNIFDKQSDVYTVAVLRKYSFVTAGALISRTWVITDANELYNLKHRTRELHVRIGSKNYKNGGINVPVKYFETHPSFNDTSPNCDIALVQLAEEISRNTAKPINLWRYQRGITSSHFIVTYWTVPIASSQRNEFLTNPTRLLQTNNLHPGNVTKCQNYLKELNITYNNNLMCLDPIAMEDPCSRETWRGAPVVLDDHLLGVISSWVPGYCDLDTSIFVNIVSSNEIFTWINSTVWNI